MSNLSKDDKIQLGRIFESIQGRIDKNLIKLIMDFIFGTKVKTRKEDLRLFSINLKKIPDESLEAFSLGDFFGQAYQISLNFATKMNLKLNTEQKRILREYVFFLVLLKFEKESNRK
ncbi:MAG: hypothetical protein OEQ12_03060 [Nitrosopumilus sp.]|nr:hypothetical protein [Nitrosopumilus sp.]